MIANRDCLALIPEALSPAEAAPLMCAGITTFNSLRHSGASIHIMRGTPIPEVSAMLGHANVNITLTVYTHFVPKMRSDAASTLAAAIFSGEKTFVDQIDHLKDTSEEKAVVS